MPNTNCLKNVACPSCGYEEEFQVTGRAVFIIRDAGVEHTSNVDWSDAAEYMSCRKCLHEGTYGEFCGGAVDSKSSSAFAGTVPILKEETSDESVSSEEESGSDEANDSSTPD